MIENFDIEEFCDFHEIDLKWNYYDEYIDLNVNLTYDNKVIGRCSLHNINKKDLSNEDLFWFFDGIELVAGINFSDIGMYNDYILNRMKTRRFMYLTNMYIEAEYRNMGVGSVFLQDVFVILNFMKIRDIYLVSAMYEDNKEPYKNEGFYLKNGFEIINDTKDMFDGKMMQLE